MPNPVSALSQSIALMRRAIGEAKHGSNVPRPADVARQKNGSEALPRRQIETLPQRLEMLRGLVEDERRRKALRLFLEAVLLDELGEEALLSAEFGDLVERVARSLEESPSATGMLAEALDELLPHG